VPSRPKGLRGFRAEESAGVDFTQGDLLGMSRHCDYGSEGAGGEREHEDDEKDELIHVVFPQNISCKVVGFGLSGNM
jgi:hypothetical protein